MSSGRPPDRRAAQGSGAPPRHSPCAQISAPATKSRGAAAAGHGRGPCVRRVEGRCGGKGRGVGAPADGRAAPARAQRRATSPVSARTAQGERGRAG